MGTYFTVKFIQGFTNRIKANLKSSFYFPSSHLLEKFSLSSSSSLSSIFRFKMIIWLDRNTILSRISKGYLSTVSYYFSDYVSNADGELQNVLYDTLHTYNKSTI